MSRLGSTLLLACAAATPLSAQQDAKALLEQVVATYKAARSYRFESVREGGVSSELHRSWSRSSEVLARDGDGRVRYEVIDSGGSYVVVSDGETLWIASPDTREFLRKPLAGPLFETKGVGPLGGQSLNRAKFSTNQFDRLADNLIRAERMGIETIEVNGEAIECVVVRADHSAPRGAIGIQSWTRTLWIDPRRHLVLKEENVTRGKLFPQRPFEDAESRNRKRYLVASIDEPLPAELFVYTPPRNYREVDTLERAFLVRRAI